MEVKMGWKGKFSLFINTKQSDKHASKPNNNTYNYTINKLLFLYKACRIAKYGTLATLLEWWLIVRQSVYVNQLSTGLCLDV